MPKTTLALLAGVALIMSSCGGGTADSATADVETTAVATDGAATPGADAFLACLGEQGIAEDELPDFGGFGPGGRGMGGGAPEEGQAPPQQDMSDELARAMEACRDSIGGGPGGGGFPGGGDRGEMQERFTAWAECLEGNGYRPPESDLAAEPEGGGPGGPFGSIDMDDPAYAAAAEACTDLEPFGGMDRGGPPPTDG